MFEYSGKIRSIDVRKPKLDKKILDLLRKSNTVLDVGCASGRLASYLDTKTKYIGLSYSQSDVDVVKKKGYDAYLVNLDKDSIPLQDESVDCIYASHIIEHFEKKELIQLMKEFRRVLAKDGYIILATPTDYSSFFYAEWTHVRPYNHGSLPGLLNDFGFKNVDWMYPKISFLPKKYQAILRFPLFFLKNSVWKEIFARGRK